MPKPSVSPYCNKCSTETHGGYAHFHHDTSEHNSWWANVSMSFTYQE